MAGFLAESGKRIVAVAARLNLRRHVGAVGACTGRTGPPAIVATKPGNPGAENVGAVEADVRLIVVRITASKAKAGQVDVDPVPVEQGERNGSRKTFEVDLAGATTLAFGSANIASPGGHEISVLKFEIFHHRHCRASTSRLQQYQRKRCADHACLQLDHVVILSVGNRTLCRPPFPDTRHRDPRNSVLPGATPGVRASHIGTFGSFTVVLRPWRQAETGEG